VDGPSSDVHALEPEDFLEEVHSFEHWFGAVETYLADLDHGHRRDLPDPELPADEQDRLIATLSNYVVAETAALEASSGLIRIAPNRQTRVFLSTQVVDEGRHVEVLLHRLRELGVADPEQTVEQRAGPSIRRFRERLLALVDSHEWDTAIFAQNVVLEAMEYAVFGVHAKRADPVTRDVLERILRDERRHIGFGENEIGRRIRENPGRRDWIRAIKAQLDALAIETFADALEELAVPRTEREAVGRDYHRAVARLGL
jgi:1,2-phenylacetyl-CoA epoxidase catalytic subunit